MQHTEHLTGLANRAEERIMLRDVLLGAISMNDLIEALEYYANEDNYRQCEENGWYCLPGPIEHALPITPLQPLLHPATVAQRALEKVRKIKETRHE
jgi:hypothetical protein